MNRTRRTLTALTAAALTLTLAAPAQAGSRHRTRTTTAISAQEGCGPDGLALTATWKTARHGKVTLVKVLADNDDRMRGFPLGLTVTDATGVVRYGGPNGHGRVGDGLDYEWIRGWERNTDGVRVPIGASDLNPAGWRPLTGPGFTVRAVLAEARYCTTSLTIGAP